MVVNILWVFVWMVFMLFMSEAKVTWTVEKQISKYGEVLELLCISDDYEMLSERSKRWYRGSEQKLLTINEVDKPKYSASIESNGFKLIIKNLTENDVNVTYQCEYGFTKSENLLLLAKDVFIKDFPGHKEEVEESGGKIAEILGIVFSMIAVLIFIIVISVCAILYKRGQLVMVTKICCNGEPQNAEDQYDGVQYNPVQPNETNGTNNQQTNIVIDNEANRCCHHPSNEDQYDGVRYNPVPPNKTNGTDNQQTNIANGCHHPSNEVPFEEIETTGNASYISQTEALSNQVAVLCDDKMTEHSPGTSHTSLQEFAISSGKYRAYSKKRVREQSFTEWSLNSPSIQKMANAGFFYRGCNTYAQCFCCGFNQKWRENDDPFSSSLHNANCSYSQKVNDSSAQVSNPSSPDSEQTIPKSME